jgi:4-hydroxybenzoate polyprenyltransferase
MKRADARLTEVSSRSPETGPPYLARASSVVDLWRLLRPTQWSKNTVLFAALIFAKHLFEPRDVLLVSLGFVCFCAIASGAYVMNDLRDCERDRQHPLKSQRPLPSGRVSRGTATVLALVLMSAGLTGSFVLSGGFATLACLYLLLQVGYTFWLKEVVILDVMAIAAGFVIRAGAGGVLINVPVSPWLIICTFLLMMFLGFFLDQMIAVVTASTVVAYAIYTVSPEVREKLGTDKLYLTIPFVLFGIFRYLYLVHQREEGGNPTQLLLSDRPLLLDVLLWVVTAALLLYWKL